MKIDPSTPERAVLEEFAQRLARLRRSRGLTQAQLAERAGLGVMTLRRMEDGRDAKLASWIRVLRALDLTASLEAFLPEDVRSPLEEVRGRRGAARRPKGERDAGFRWGDER